MCSFNIKKNSGPIFLNLHMKKVKHRKAKQLPQWHIIGVAVSGFESQSSI